jgi:IS5 family transposase
MEQQIRVTLNGILADAGIAVTMRCPNIGFKVYTTGQKRRMTSADPAADATPFRRPSRSSGISKASNRIGRNYLAHRLGDAVNPLWPPPGITCAGCSPG